MKLVKQSFEILEQEIPVQKMSDDSGTHFREEYIKNMYKHIEKCGRTCYKSENRITEDSAEKFVNGLIKSSHLSVLEHGAVYLKIPITGELFNKIDIIEYRHNPYVKYTISKDFAYITTNYRVLIENHWEEDLQYLCEPTEHHEKRHTVLLHSCIHAYKDLTRHRKMSFSIESTRYCNYSKTDKFGEMKFVLPPWVSENYNYDWADCGDDCDQAYPCEDTTDSHFTSYLANCEYTYNKLISFGWQPQQAAEILPQCTAADVVMSGFSSDWEFVFRLRSDIAETGQPHPLVEELMTPLRNEFVNRNYINKL